MQGKRQKLKAGPKTRDRLNSKTLPSQKEELWKPGESIKRTLEDLGLFTSEVPVLASSKVWLEDTGPLLTGHTLINIIQATAKGDQVLLIGNVLKCQQPYMRDFLLHSSDTDQIPI